MDVIVVGAGVIGFAVARELSSRGARTRVVDMRGAGQGASRASAGMLAPYIEGHHPPLLELGCSSNALYDAFVEQLRTESGHSIEFRRCGTLQVARTEQENARLTALSRELAGRGVPHAFLDGARVREYEPAVADAVRTGILIPEHGYVKVAELIAALAAAAARSGAALIKGRVEGVERTAAGCRVRLDDETLDADAVVIAAGSWSGPLTSPPVPVRPIRGQLVQLRFPAPPLSTIVWGDGCYLVPWMNGSLLLGATSEDAGFDETSTAAAVETLRAAASQQVPSTAAATVEEVRVGLRPATADELPIIGRSSTMAGVFYATGHYRNGVLLAPLTAALIADLVMDNRESPMLEMTRPDRLGL